MEENEKNKEIKAWLDSEREFYSGRALFFKYGGLAGHLTDFLNASREGDQRALSAIVYELEKLITPPKKIRGFYHTKPNGEKVPAPYYSF